MIRHIVFVKFKSAAAPEQIEEFRQEVDRLPAYNAEVMNWASGRSVEPRFHSGDFDWGLSVDLKDWDAMDRYMWHEGHLRTAAVAATVVDSMISFDFEIEVEVSQGDGSLATERKPAQSLEAGMTVVPELRGRTLENAERLLGDRKLRIAEPPNEIEGHVWAPGRVLATEPAAGEAVPEGSSVGLTIASGWTVTAHRS